MTLIENSSISNILDIFINLFRVDNYCRESNSYDVSLIFQSILCLKLIFKIASQVIAINIVNVGMFDK